MKRSYLSPVTAIPSTKATFFGKPGDRERTLIECADPKEAS